VPPPRALLHFSTSKKPLKPLLVVVWRSAAQYASERAFAWGSKVAQSSSWYDAHAPALVHRYELIDPATMYGWLSGLLSNATGTVLDVGAGSGRDAEWFAA
jgi:hypothetical protein